MADPAGVLVRARTIAENVFFPAAVVALAEVVADPEQRQIRADGVVAGGQQTPTETPPRSVANTYGCAGRQVQAIGRQFGITVPAASEDRRVPTRQYASFELWSRRMPASEMAARLGIEPDEISVRGANLVDPPVPVSHEWKVTCRVPEIGVDEQIGRLVERLTPFAVEIGKLAERLERDDCGGARLRIVRHFSAEGRADSEFGWHLDRQVLRLLQITHADLRVDEHNCA